MIILCGMTSSGKDYVKKLLLEAGMNSIVTHTTRPMRKGEIDGQSYHFISTEEFLKLEKENYFVETAYYDVASKERWYYGTSYKSLSKDLLEKVLILNPIGIKSIFEKLTPVELSTVFVVYLYCDESTIKERLIKRGDNPEEAKRRIEADKRDFADIADYANLAICNDGSLSKKELIEMIVNSYDRFLIE